MPKRGEFEVEFDYEAEDLLGDMEYIDPDDAAESSFKDKLIQLYNNRLDHRILRKKLLIERNLLLDTKRYKSKDEREQNAYYKIFMRFMKSAEHYDRFMSLVTRHRMLSAAIERLVQFRSMGKQTLAEVQQYMDEYKKRPEQQKSNKPPWYSEAEEFLSQANKGDFVTPMFLNNLFCPKTSIDQTKSITILQERERALCKDVLGPQSPTEFAQLKRKMAESRHQNKDFPLIY